MNLFIIGYRCTGKTTTAQTVSERMGWKFIDADRELMEKRGESVSEIVSSGGWPLFRKLEKQTLKEICRQERQVVATGGGVILDDENIETMKNNGPVIWLKATPETIIERMTADTETEELRPALTDHDLISEINETLNERIPLYQKAMTWSVDTDGKKINEVISEILSLIESSNIISPDTPL